MVGKHICDGWRLSAGSLSIDTIPTDALQAFVSSLNKSYSL